MLIFILEDSSLDMIILVSDPIVSNDIKITSIKGTEISARGGEGDEGGIRVYPLTVTFIALASITNY